MVPHLYCSVALNGALRNHCRILVNIQRFKKIKYCDISLLAECKTWREEC